MTPAIRQALVFWRAAQASPLGIGLTTSDPAAAKRQLYAARAKSGDPSLAAIAIRTSPERPSTDLWLLRDRSEPTQARDTSDPIMDMGAFA